MSRNESAELVESVIAEISGALERGEMVKISSFGSFAVRQKGPARRAQSEDRPGGADQPAPGAGVPRLACAEGPDQRRRIGRAPARRRRRAGGRRRRPAEVTRADETAAGSARQEAAAAFRTIGEVAEELDLPAHVLRFWESKFPQVKPLKARRRPALLPAGRHRSAAPDPAVPLPGRLHDPRRAEAAARGRAAQRRAAAATARRRGARRDAVCARAGRRPAPAAGARHPRRQALREALEEVRRELLEIRALLDKLAPR